MPRPQALTAAQVAAAVAEHDATRRPWKCIAVALGCSERTIYAARNRLTGLANSFSQNATVAGRESAAVEPNPRTLSASPEAAHGNALGDER